MKILFCSSEVYPYSKTGGLADVAYALPLALGKRSHDVMIVTPRYRGISRAADGLSSSVRVRFVKNDAFFNRLGLYGTDRGDFPDNAERFSFFSRELLETAQRENFRPDIVHLNDWQTALVPLYLEEHRMKNSFFTNSRSLLTIHNLAYQGAFPAREFGKLGLAARYLSSGDMGFYGRISFLKAGILHADRVSTVSKTYAREILTEEKGAGLEGVLRSRGDRIAGIVNGLDTDVWDPAGDRAIKRRYDRKSIERKSENKTHLQKMASLEMGKDIPLFGAVSRLVSDKGWDLLVDSFGELMDLGIQVVVLGTGEARYHRFFSRMSKKYRGRAAFFLGFQSSLASQIYAGSDFFLMPSRLEPCGLGQLIAFRYGAVPVVHHTGGLKDTVSDLGARSDRGSGFVFRVYSKSDFLKAVKCAVRLYRSRALYRKVQKRIMGFDFSWGESASHYEALYRSMLRH